MKTKGSQMLLLYLDRTNQTHTAFAASMAMNRNTVRRWLRGDSTPNKVHLHEMHRRANIKPGEWFEGVMTHHISAEKNEEEPQ